MKNLLNLALTLSLLINNISADEIGGTCVSSLGGVEEPLQDPQTWCDIKCRDRDSKYDSHYCAGMKLMCKCK